MLFWNISFFYDPNLFRQVDAGIEIEHSSLAQRPGRRKWLEIIENNGDVEIL